MDKQQSTEKVLHSLVDTQTKEEMKLFIESKFEEITSYFAAKGHNIDKKKGFVGRQVLADNDIFIYQYYRDMHFIYWGLQGDWSTFDPFDKIYYFNLQRIIEELYSNKA